MKKISTLLTFALLNHTVSFGQTKIPIEEVSKNIGKTVTVCGKISGVKYEKPNLQRSLFTMVGFEPNDKVTVVFHPTDPKSIEGKVQDTFTGKNVCVTGKLARVNGDTELFIDEPQDIQIQNGGGGSEIKLKDFLPFD